MVLVLEHFIQKCDYHSNTLTIFKAKQSSYIFGGFTTVNWESCPDPGKPKSDPNAFIFSLTNKDNKPLKMKIDPNKHQHAIGCHSKCGPLFGWDIQIDNNANTTMESRSRLGHTYSHPHYAEGTNEAKNFLTGAFKFQLEKI
jgi:hypothetical protein